MVDIVDQKIFGQVIRQTHVIKFQKRGLPYAYILLILDNWDKFQNTTDVDTTHILNWNKDTIFHYMVVKHIIHEQYNINPNSVWLHLYTKICTKGFLKPFQEKTKWLPDIGYPLYKKAEIPDQENNPCINNR